MIPFHLRPPRIDTPPPFGKATLRILRIRYLLGVALPPFAHDLLDALVDQSPHPDLEIDAKFDDLRELVKALPLSREQLRFALNWVIFAQQYWAKGEPVPARLHVETVCRKFAEEIATFCQDREFRELELFQGIWRPVSTVHDGRSMPDLVYRRAIVIGNTYFVFHAYKVDRWGTFKIGAEPCLRRIDTIPVIGNNAGGHVQGICEMDDEALRLCFAPDDRDPNNPDGSRPSEFYAPSGSGCWMTKDVHIAVF